MFQGPAALALDGKGRVAMPARHREQLASKNVRQLTITKSPEGALMIFPQPVWDSFAEKLAALPMSASGWKRVFLGNAMEVEVDSASRVLIAQELRVAAGLNREVMLLGMGNHLELWDAAAYAEHEAKVMASDMPDSLKDFSF